MLCICTLMAIVGVKGLRFSLVTNYVKHQLTLWILFALVDYSNGFSAGGRKSSLQGKSNVTFLPYVNAVLLHVLWIICEYMLVHDNFVLLQQFQNSWKVSQVFGHPVQSSSQRVNISVTCLLFYHILLQVENQLAVLTTKYARLVAESDEAKKRMKNRIETLEADNANLSFQLDEEKRWI